MTPIVILESESEEGDKVNGQSSTRGMMNLITLTKKDIKTTEGKSTMPALTRYQIYYTTSSLTSE